MVKLKRIIITVNRMRRDVLRTPLFVSVRGHCLLSLQLPGSSHQRARGETSSFYVSHHRAGGETIVFLISVSKVLVVRLVVPLCKSPASWR